MKIKDGIKFGIGLFLVRLALSVLFVVGFLGLVLLSK